MRGCRFVVPLVLIVLAFPSIPSAWAGTVRITTLFNTGVDANGTLLGNGVVDPHYILTLSPNQTYSFTYTLTDPTAYPYSLWAPGTQTSKWILPAPDQQQCCLGGYYLYSTTFNLPHSFNPNKDTAAISGFWASDNNAVDILINEKSTGNSIPFGTYPNWSFQNLTPFSINSGFDKGPNTLGFLIYNDAGAPTGLHVQMTGIYDLKPVPEPSLPVLLVIGLVGVIGCGWRCGST